MVVGQCRSIVTGIQDKVRLFQGQRIGSRITPLFQHLVAYRPHQDTGMVTVAQHQVGEVTLVPLVKEAGIVVLRLTATPHVETLVHDDEAHGVAHVEQLGSRRVMAGTNGIAAHGFQLRQLSVQGVLVKGSPQTAEVMVLADPVQLHVLAVEPETRLGIETEVAESRRRPHLIHHPAAYQQLRAYLIYIGVGRRPEPQGRLRHLEIGFLS